MNRLRPLSGLYAVTQDPSIVEGYERAVLTPNVMEFKYLCEKKVRGLRARPDGHHRQPY
jgi:NAD(P)H-hydrate repair Nnr-like enzyme with NAD(P)H-hydrate dehydratase domain